MFLPLESPKIISAQKALRIPVPRRLKVQLLACKYSLVKKNYFLLKCGCLLQPFLKILQSFTVLLYVPLVVLPTPAVSHLQELVFNSSLLEELSHRVLARLEPLLL